MTTAKSILLVDNDNSVLDALALSLGRRGYKVSKANSVERAQSLFNKNIFHLGIVDLRLEDDGKQADTSGFDVAKTLAPRIPCMIYTAYEDRENVRRAFSEVGAKEVVSKNSQHAARELVNAVDHLFLSDVKVNFNLEIEGDFDKLLELVRQIQIPEADEETSPAEEDIRQILQTLFYDQSIVKIELEPVFQPKHPSETPIPPRNDAVLVKVRPYFKYGSGLPVMVKFGECKKVGQEYEHYRRLKPFLGGQQLTVLEGPAYSRKIGGLIYTFIGAGEQLSLQSLRDIILTDPPESIIELLEQFFKQTFGPIFADATREEIDLTTSYTQRLDLTPQKLQTAAASFRPELLTDEVITIDGLSEPFKNPISWILSETNEFRQFEVFSRTSLIHGGLTSHNILVDQLKHFWLTDFAQAGEFHALHDFISLEADIKFNLLPLDNLEALFEFEMMLLSPTTYEDNGSTIAFEREELNKAGQIILSLRQLASDLINLRSDMRAYYQALLFYSLNVLGLPSDGTELTSAKKRYALLSAALLCERLESWPTWQRSTPKAGANVTATLSSKSKTNDSSISAKIQKFVGNILGHN
ncbi:MAG: response regulator [Anaerolineaceae bacterium]|nr:response regulator [Anaerolineaceae bacterium]MCB9100485.1 response regulator [Anaerolineales bacterium]